MFAALSALEQSGSSGVDLALDSSAEIVGKMERWSRIVSSSHEGPWERARHIALLASWVDPRMHPLRRGAEWSMLQRGRFRRARCSRKNGFHQPKRDARLVPFLLQFCQRHPDALRRVQVSWVGTTSRFWELSTSGAPKKRVTPDLLVRLLDFQLKHGFMLPLKWVPTAANGVADAISRPSRDTVMQLVSAAFRRVWDTLGPFKIDLMACTAALKRLPRTGDPLFSFSRYDCAGSQSVDFLAQDVSVLSGTSDSAFFFVSSSSRDG